MPNQLQNQKVRKFDLNERTANFGEEVIDFVKKIEINVINKSLVSQLVRSATSIGANYMEADAGESKKDFQHKIGLCKKEAKETLHWLRMIARCDSKEKDVCRKLWKEAHELVLIFSAILRKKTIN